MPVNRDAVERLDLTFRAEPAEMPPQRSVLPGGWWLWCLTGALLGIAGWLAGRQQLTSSLTTQLTESGSVAEAMLAVEGLLMLDADASIEIVRGLEHEKLEVARTAYRTLDSQITRWKELEPAVGMAHMQTLADRLRQLPDTTPSDNLVLASSLASRIFSICLERDDPQWRPLMRVCEVVFQRLGTARSRLDSNLQQLDTNLATSLPPPPVDVLVDVPVGQLNETGFTQSAMEPVDPLGIQNAAGDNAQNRLSDTPNGSTPNGLRSGQPTASLQMKLGPTQPRMRQASTERLVAGGSLNDGDHPSGVDYGAAAFSLGDYDEDQAEADTTSQSNELPVVMNRPASLSTTPLVQMKVVSNQVDLDGVQHLEIEELVRLLGHTQSRVAQAAALALRAKGMDDEKLTLASELACGTAARRLELVQQIASNGRMEPRPWLLWMAEDGEPEVRKLAVSLLSSMLDSQVERSLRNLLTRERDPAVERAIREVLLVRGGVR
jgi:hypothetical protein